MIKQQIAVFLLRWLASSFGMWICITLFGTITDPTYDIWLFVIAGLVFSLVNAVVKPLLTMMALPLIIVTLGIFTFIINIAMFSLTVWIIPEVQMSFGGALLSAIVMGMINSIANFLVPSTPNN